MRPSNINQQSSTDLVGIARSSLREIKASAQSVARRVHKDSRTSGAREGLFFASGAGGVGEDKERVGTERGRAVVRGWARRGAITAGDCSTSEVG